MFRRRPDITRRLSPQRAIGTLTAPAAAAASLVYAPTLPLPRRPRPFDYAVRQAGLNMQLGALTAPAAPAPAEEAEAEAPVAKAGPPFIFWLVSDLDQRRQALERARLRAYRLEARAGRVRVSGFPAAMQRIRRLVWNAKAGRVAIHGGATARTMPDGRMLACKAGSVRIRGGAMGKWRFAWHHELDDERFGELSDLLIFHDPDLILLAQVVNILGPKLAILSRPDDEPS